MKYLWAVRSVLWVAEQIGGRHLTLIGLFREESLLGQALASDIGREGKRRSRWTVAHHRTAIRAAATLLRPELIEQLGESPHEIIRRALRGAATPLGSGFRLAGGRPRGRGGPVPTPTEVAAILGALGARGDWRAARDRALCLFLTSTASRISAARNLDAADCHVMSDGTIRTMLYQKSHRTPREVELSEDTAVALRYYVALANASSVAPPLALGTHGPVWRAERGGKLPDQAFRDALRAACARAGVQDYTPHAFRRFWATQASLKLSRWEAALGGGWKGTAQFDAHYAQPSRTDVWAKLGRLDTSSASAPVFEAYERELAVPSP